MLLELAAESENQGLKMNKSKTNVMMENDTPIYVNNTLKAFAKHRDIFKGNTGKCLKR